MTYSGRSHSHLGVVLKAKGETQKLRLDLHVLMVELISREQTTQTRRG